MSIAVEKSSKANRDMLPLLRDRNRSLTTFGELLQLCKLDDLLTGNCCKECVTRSRENLGIGQVFQYISNEAKISDRSIVVQMIVIKRQLFECWCGKI